MPRLAIRRRRHILYPASPGGVTTRQPATRRGRPAVVGAVGPAFYGVLIGNGGNRAHLAFGYLVGGGT